MARAIRQLWYITHLDNLGSIFIHGILSRKQVKKRRIAFRDISDQGVQQRRKDYHDYVPLFFADNTPMLYTVCNEYGLENICLIAISAKVLNREGVLFCDGNLAAKETRVYQNIKDIPENYWQIIFSRRAAWGTDKKGYNWKRIRSAEVLIPQEVPTKYLKSISVSSLSDVNRVIECVLMTANVDLTGIPIYSNLTSSGISSGE